jgi:hypothetical protein
MGRWAYFNTRFSYKFGSQQDSADIGNFGGYGYVAISQDDLELAFEEHMEISDEFQQETLLGDYNTIKILGKQEKNQYILTLVQYNEYYTNTFVSSLGRFHWTWKDTAITEILEHLKDSAFSTDFSLEPWLTAYKLQRDANPYAAQCTILNAIHEEMRGAYLGEDRRINAEHAQCILGTLIYLQKLECADLGCFYEA